MQEIKGQEDFFVGLILLGFIGTIILCAFIVRIFRIVGKKNKEISIKDQVIDIQKEIIEHQPRILTRNHDN